MLKIKAFYSRKKGKTYVAVFDKNGRIVTFDIKVWLPIASEALGTDGYDDTKAALEKGHAVIVGGEKV